MTKYLDEINFRLDCNKKSSFSTTYKYDGSAINITGKDAYPTRYELPKEVELLQNCKNCHVSIYPSSKKQPGVFQVFEASGDDDKEMFWEFFIDENSFGRLETNLINNGKDFLEKLVIQITVDRKDIAKLKEKGNIHSLKIIEASIHFNTKNQIEDD